MRTVAYTATALMAFAANSVLCRVALGEVAIDAASFSTIRLISGAIALVLAALLTDRRSFRIEGSWTSAGMLFLYAFPFAFAYNTLSTGTGALVLFGSVQVTMMAFALWSGERPHPLQWFGFALALAGLVYLVFPGLSAPSLQGVALMSLAGFSWGVYSLRGQGEQNPLAQTTGNFLRAAPLAALVSAITIPHFHLEPKGVFLAIASGALASGLGYAVWYRALRDLTATRAAAVQLSVPILAAAGGVIFLFETVSARLVISAVMVLGGVGVALLGRERKSHTIDPLNGRAHS